MTNATQIETDIQTALDEHKQDRATFIPTRYPFTYGYDFLRAHASHFGFNEGPYSRGDAANLTREYAQRTGLGRPDIIIALADAYLTRWDIEATDEQKEAALAHQRQVAWKSMGLDAPPAS